MARSPVSLLAEAFRCMPAPAEPVLPAFHTEVQPGVWLDTRLALWIPTEGLLVVADLHWGYAASHRARGNLLPAWGDDEIERRLRSLVADYHPQEMLWLGDIVHAAEGAGAAEKYLRTSDCRVTPLAGNHDRRWRGATETSTQRGRFFFHHGDVDRPVPPATISVIGHHHPALAWSDGAGGNLKLPALVASPSRLVLPAFSPWAAGTPCGHLLTPDAQVWAITPKRIFAVRSPERSAASV